MTLDISSTEAGLERQKTSKHVRQQDPFDPPDVLTSPTATYNPNLRRRDSEPYPNHRRTGTTTDIELRDLTPNRRSMARTPSPTPSEEIALTTGAIDWKAMKSWRFWIRWEWRWYYPLAAILGGLAAVISIKSEDIVRALTPANDWLHDTPAAWLIPIAILMVLCYPPLFGQEIVAMLCGVVWGLWIGFGIVAAGTLFGEILAFYSFQSCCTARAKKAENSTLSYACFAQLVREGGFKVALMVRLSVIPPHCKYIPRLLDLVFALCGMNIFIFIAAAFLSLPKQMILVYLGVALAESGNGQSTPTSKAISAVAIIVGLIISVLTMAYIVRRMDKIKPRLIYEKRQARKGKVVDDRASVLNNAASEINLTIT
ncbi:hypothetical protein D9758_012317 [Tetrapyrgos nigripes]|uniref:Golgi apparatus membrane protein TVP38 n=1 Tax=Tetrapyrgos nigripes TaxID=182062 RepID=A0A8H5CM04_9AGAR|nr:hypothetical protein D9758_012317 [Tetrapyrgos nigripes]